MSHHPEETGAGDSHARALLDEMSTPYLGSWSAAIRSYTLDGLHAEALTAFCRMRRAGSMPDCYAVAAATKSCAALSEAQVGLGKSIHGFVAKARLGSASAVEKALMDMYARFGSLHDSSRIFARMRSRDLAAWNVLLSGYSRSQLYLEAMGFLHLMHASSDEEAKPNSITVAIVLPVCAKLRHLKGGRAIHAYVIKVGLEAEILVGNALISMYAKCGSVTGDACRVFNSMPCRDVVSWNSIIAGYIDGGFVAEAFGSFCQMVSTGSKPNYATVVNVLPVCALMERGCYWGEEIHCHVLRSAMGSIVSVSNALITHYARVGDLKRAEHVFRHMHFVDLVSWNTLIGGYAMNGWHWRAIELFRELISLGLEPDAVTLITVLPVCAHLYNIEEGTEIHDYVLGEPSLRKDTSVGNALVSFYGKCGRLDDALRTFAEISDRDLISWNAMLGAYSYNENEQGVVDILYQMHEQGVRPDSVTVLTLLQVCPVLGIGKIREIHGYSIRSSLIDTPTVGNAFVDMYAKCGYAEHSIKAFKSLSERNIISGNTMISAYMKHGSLEDARLIFDEMSDKDLATWNLMIQAYAQNDCIDPAISLFHMLQRRSMKPDLMSIMSILPVCARLASVHLVRQCHGYMIRAWLDDIRLEGAFLDAYCKCGRIYDAQKLFQTSSHKDLVAYTAMVGGYAMNGMAEEALTIFHQMLGSDIKPDHVIITALLSSCSHAGLVDEGLKLFNSIGGIHRIEPTMEHYACVVDLFARRGQLREAYDFIVEMPCEANANVWGTLLGACRIYGEVEIGQLVANHLFSIEEKNIGNYVVMSNIYAADARWDAVEQVRNLLKTKDLRKPAGCSWIEVERERHVFVAEDSSHPQRSLIYHTLEDLNQQIKVPFNLDELILN